MKKVLVTTMGLLLLLGGCSTNKTEETSTPEKAATTETSTTKSSTTQSSAAKASKSTSTEATKLNTTESSERQSTKDQSASVVAQPKTSSNQAQTNQPVKHVLWDASKSAELATFMQSWGQEMGQQYRSYDDHVQANYYGLQVPQDILDGKWTTVINQTPVSIEWTETGEGTADFQIVAIYSDIDHATPAGGHLYFFGFQQKQPKVLITQQNQGNQNNYLYFKETENESLKNEFIQLANR
ncbi:DUF4767 domain-containing protein [Enterococcus gallinarum]|uniref:DUF4767 domain-containing protein n=1 Tax=Enterococcus gallinarum TaxID=1353 RepID=UPI001D173B29|nr:DUF4767 domain-containing protein [Enterococcus gallinarum]MCC4044340.1 DUF4767 domain-containing protein [Enterococcus gallinarum]